MSAMEDDTELRDLLIQNLENNGVLNKLKAEMRAAVFLAMDEQDKVENKTPLVNENLKKCLNTKDGRLVASLIIDFLQAFNLDFTLAVFQPEINSLNGLDSREQVSRELGVAETEVNRNTPLLLELVKRNRHREKPTVVPEGDKPPVIPKELSPKQIADARKKFDFYDKDRTGGVRREDLKAVLGDLFPNFNKNMLERHATDELRVLDKAPGKSIDFQQFLGVFKRFFLQCRAVATHDTSDVPHAPSRFTEESISATPASKIPRFKGLKHSGQEEGANAKGVEVSQGDPGLSAGSLKGKGQGQVSSRHGDDGSGPGASLKKAPEEAEEDQEADEGDSFFDDPLPKPQKTYGCTQPTANKNNSGVSLSQRGNSQKDLSALGSDTDGDGDELFSDYDHKHNSGPRRADVGRAVGSPLDSLSDAAPQSSLSGEAGHRDFPACKNGTSNSPKDKGFKDFKTMNDKTGSLAFDDDVDYDDDFNSHRSDISKSEVSIGEEIEEVSIEGPDNSDKFDEVTQDLSITQDLSQAGDYMEEVA